MRIDVFCDSTEAWHRGNIDSVDGKKVRITYDDGSVRTHNDITLENTKIVKNENPDRQQRHSTTKLRLPSRSERLTNRYQGP